jgi:hypothetical protein
VVIESAATGVDGKDSLEFKISRGTPLRKLPDGTERQFGLLDSGVAIFTKSAQQPGRKCGIKVR